MKIIVPAPSHRVVSYIVLLQSFIVVAGTLYVTATFKAYELDVFGQSHVPPSALFVRYYGFFVLLLPMVWAAATILVAKSRLNVWFNHGLVCLGIFAIPVGLTYYLVLGALPFQPVD